MLKNLRSDFPLLADQPQLVYLDSAATSQKPAVVIDAVAHYYRTQNANVHRGVHQLSDKSTAAWENARQVVANFFGATSDELIVTRNTTEAINGVIYGWALDHLQPGDVVMASLLEHHSNLVPWQQICARTGAQLKLIPVLPDGKLDEAWFESHLDAKVKLLAISHVSNALGTVNDVAQMARQAHRMSALVLVDAAQSAPHLPINFDQMGVDFLAFSGHKMLGPMGVGGLLVRRELLEKGLLKPWLFGGGMIASVLPESATFQSEPAERFTAGTPDVASMVGLAAACQYLTKLKMHDVAEHDAQLVKQAWQKLSRVAGVQLVGPTPDQGRVGSVTFLVKGAHAHDVAQVLDSCQVAVRSGHHCTMPLHQHFGWAATVRASFQVYTTQADIDALVEALAKVKQVLKCHA